jgi:hypothetical protein
MGSGSLAISEISLFRQLNAMDHSSPRRIPSFYFIFTIWDYSIPSEGIYEFFSPIPPGSLPAAALDTPNWSSALRG